MADYPDVPLVLLLTSSIDDHLYACFGYRYVDRIGPVELHGKVGSDGLFQPVVRYEVAVGPNKWRTLSQSSRTSDPTAIRIDSVASHAMLEIDMDPFRPMIGKYRLGRIVLENGESVTFSLDNLLPTGDNPADRDYKAAVSGDNPDRFGSSFCLVAVVSLSGHLTGEFALIGDTRRAPELTGQRDDNGEFSPVVTWETGNSNEDLQIVRESRQPEHSTRLTIFPENRTQTIQVDLDPLKRAIGKVKYGKVIFSNGDFSAFELDQLKPPFTRAPRPADRE
jgi:hypothetical protein